MIALTAKEKDIASKITRVKEQSGSHAPNIFTIADQVKELDIKMDCCFLSNPYATDLFLKFLEKELVATKKLRDVLEFYPSQNRAIAGKLARSLGISPNTVFIGNGATEIIQAVVHNFVKKKMLISIPTFSAYMEFARRDTEVALHRLEKSNNFKLDPDKLLRRVHAQQPDTVVIINPNNPDGGYLPMGELEDLLNKLRYLENIVLDESFIHFAHEGQNYKLHSSEKLVEKFPNLIVIKSMSKDFGIAGIRVGYAVMAKEKVDQLLRHGYLWNVSGLGEYFLDLYVRPDFQRAYDKIRIQAIEETAGFFKALSKIPSIRVFPTMANFALVELLDGSKADVFVAKLLIKHGIYVRNCADKIGLDGEFVRIASRKKGENGVIVDAVKRVLR
jgi:histidinol-phosphate/aromatic aminotransferase/cobyric acid decarboxylase-like protein